MTATAAIPDPVARLMGERAQRTRAGEARERRKDRVLPILIIASLIVHLLILLPSLLSHDATPFRASAPREIPVEVVQEPPARPPPPAAAPKKESAKPEAAKPEALPPEPAKPAARKPPAEKPQAPTAVKTAREKAVEPPKPTASGEQRMKDLLGPMPAIALPGADAAGTDEVSYEQLVLSKLSKAKDQGRHQGTPADTSVSFHLDDQGAVTSVTLLRPSGEKFLDDEAVAMVHRGEPYPPPPPGGRRDYTITLRFMAMP